MEGVRYRKIGNDDMGKSNKGIYSSGTAKAPYGLLRAFFYVMAFALGSTSILIMLHNAGPLKPNTHRSSFLDRASVVLGIQEKVHAIIIDAGSTGSRVLAFTFFKSLIDNSLKLEDELWHEVKPGLSSYKNDPVKGAESLIPLLELAKTRIPEAKWNSSPLVLKATAGLRLLPTKEADNLLAEVKKVLSKSNFLVSDRSVEIMNGKDEGIFSWFTVNYLLDLIQGSSQDTLVTLDLGGGSTQITFLPTDTHASKSIPQEHFSSISLFHKDYQLFTRSYLGLGLMAGRTAVLGVHHDSNGGVRSPCINPIVNITWNYNGHSLNVRGPKEPKYITIQGKAGRLSEKRPIADFAQCYKASVDVIKSQVVNSMREIRQRQVIAFSYFFDRAAERGLIDPYLGGTVTVQRFLDEAKEACQIPNVDQPFSCLDMTFIAAFLHDGYELENSTLIRLYKRISNTEVSWGLGLAFHVISNGI